MTFGIEIMIIELIGITAFAISGAIVGIKKRFDIFGIIVLGVITAVGGGMLRDILAGKVPFVLYKDIYASAAIVGAIIYYYMYILKFSPILAVTSAILITILIRLFATFYHLSLPRIPRIKVEDED